ncbi:MAG: leucine-rich repeat domain-containing protein [Clostridia bacterium]|nr:leucine-rich repeat domain-containing protein [Clostridia bacterium]
MKEIDFLDAVGRVDRQYMEECMTYQPRSALRIWTGRIGTAAACLLFMVAVILLANHMNQPFIIDANGFYIEDGVLLRYTGEETDITIPDEVKAIADFTFLENQNAERIEVVRLGKSVQTVEANAFAGLKGLEDIVIADNNLSFVEKDGLLMTADGSVLLKYKRQGEVAFAIPESVRFVAAHAVQGTELEEIDFGNIEYIGYNAFASNTKLKAIYLPDSVREIGEGAFAGCTSAVDGTLPESTRIGSGTFERVPFYNSLIAGQMCPGEEISRGLITPSEAVLKSDTDSLVQQLEYVLALLRGDTDYVPTESALFGGAAAGNGPSLPEDILLPSEVSLAQLSFADNGWGRTGIYDLQIFLPTEEYTLVFEAYGYDLYAELYWEDCRFRLVKVYYLQNPDTVEPEDTAFGFGWTAVFTRKGDGYEGITFTHEDGTIIRTFDFLTSTTPYTLTFSPDGTRAAIEYSDGSSTHLYIQSLNGDPLMEPNYDYQYYMGRYWGEYEGGSVKWIDNDNIEGVNEFGRFAWNIFEYEITQLDEDEALFDPNNKNLQSVTRELKYYTVYMELPETWRNQTIYHDLVRRGQGLEDSRMQEAEMANAWVAKSVLEELRSADPLTNKNGVTYYSVWEETPQMTLTKGTQHYVFSMDGSYQLYMYVYVYRDDPTDYLETVVLPIVDSVRLERKLTDVTLDKDSLEHWISEQGEKSTLPPYPYTLHVTGFDTPVTLEMDSYIDLGSISAYGQTLPVYAGIGLYGGAVNIDICFFEADDAVIFSWDNFGIGYTYILGDCFAEEIKPGYRYSLCFYPDENGGLRYKRSNNYFAGISQCGGLSAATGYDDLLYETGPASIVNGKLVLGDADESYAIGDVYDLDREFAENGAYEQYASIEEVFEKNRGLPGYTHDDPPVTQPDPDPVIITDFPDPPPCLSEQKQTLPEDAEKARIAYSTVGGSPVIYVFDDAMKFYFAILHADRSIASLSECTLSLPDGYTDGRITCVTGAGGSGEFRVLVAAKTKGVGVILDYLFYSENYPKPELVMLHNPSDILLHLSVSELEKTYGKLTLEYSEHGPMQPVYSVEYLDGVYLVFGGWNMDDPLEDDMIPSELIVADEVGYTVNGITVGRDISEFAHMLRSHHPNASYSVMNGTAQVKFDMYGSYSVECIISGQNLDLPDEVTATTADWEEWAERYLQNPTGIIRRIRVSPIT